MKRRAPDEIVTPFRHRYHGPEAKPIREALEEWCDEHEGNLHRRRAGAAARHRGP